MSDSDPIDDRLLGAVVAELRYGPLAPLAVEQRVLDALAREPASIRPRSIRTAWLGRAAGLALLLSGAMVAAWIGSRKLTERAPEPAGQSVRFALDATGSKRVSLVGDFNNWDPQATPLANQQGTWVVNLALRPGRYRYSFVVDGQRYLADPVRPPARDDDFGTPTSVVMVVN